MHAAVAGSFAAGDGDEQLRPIWRVDTEPSGGCYLYIVSQTMPSLVGLDEQIGFPDLPPAWASRDYDPFLARLQVGQTWAFRLTANPVQDVCQNPSQGSTASQSKRLAHVTALQQASWLVGQMAYTEVDPARTPARLDSPESNRAARNGFEVLTDGNGALQLIVSNRTTSRFTKRDHTPPIVVSSAQFDGALRVTDANLLRKALTHGIGHAKAFGCGLLTLAPVSSPAGP